MRNVLAATKWMYATLAPCLITALTGCEAGARALPADEEVQEEIAAEAPTRVQESQQVAAAAKVIKRAPLTLGTEEDFEAQYGDDKLSNNPTVRKAQLLEFNIQSLLEEAKKTSDFERLNCLNKLKNLAKSLREQAELFLERGDRGELATTDGAIEALAKRVSTECVGDDARFYVGETAVETILTEEVIVMQDEDPSEPTGLDNDPEPSLLVIPPPASGVN